jgi:outer membrane receptor protein involved in Fe transport
MSFTRWAALGSSLAFMATVGAPVAARAQGVTTGAITGTVTDATGKPLANAQVQITNRATGFSTGALTREGGRYFIQSLEVGSNYVVRVRLIGYTPVEQVDVRVNLSQSTRVDFQLRTQAAQLSAVTVTADRLSNEFSPTRQGTQTLVSDSALRRLPTINRSVTDFVRLTPQAAVQPNGNITIAGQNNRFTSFQIDGVGLANRFGLGGSQELGAQAGGRSLSLEAVKEAQILVSPFDVRQGNFTGGTVNLVTYNGTNDFEGTAFYSYRNEALARDTSFIRNNTFKRNQFGGRVTGPIIKNRLHFALTGELSRDDRPSSGPFLGQPANAVPALRINQAQVDSFSTRLTQLGIEPGSAGIRTNSNPLINTVARLDWQIGEGNRLVLRNIYNSAEQDDFSRSTATNNPLFNLTSNGFRRTDVSNSAAAQLFSNFKSGAANEFIVGYTLTRFERQPFTPAAPQILIQNVGGANNAQLRAGTENSSQRNALDENLFEVTNNFTFPVGNHTFTLGTRNEIYQATNTFLQNSYGNWTFSSLANFYAGTASNYAGSGQSALGAPVQAKFTAAQFALYLQDQWQVSPRFSLNYGVRGDIPHFFTKPFYTQQVQADFPNYRTDRMPDFVLQVSPRIGFNWDVDGRQTTQLRGGVGIFQGSPAYVWMSNQYQNTGAGLAQITCAPGNLNGSVPAFPTSFTGTPVAPRACSNLAGLTGNNAALNGQPGRSLDDPTRPFIGTVNVAADNLRFPQVFRATLAADRRLPYNLVVGVEGLYTKAVNELFYTNLNLRQQTFRDVTGRVMYGTIGANGAPTTAVVSTNYPGTGGGVLLVQNHNENYAYGVTGSLRRLGRQFEGQLAYTYSRSYSLADATSSVAYSNWQFGRVYAGRQDERNVSPSAFDQPHRILANAAYTTPFKFPTTLSLVYSGQSGTPYTYVAGGNANNGDLNGDGSASNDPIYIPTSATDANLRFSTLTVGTGASAVVYTPQQQALAFNTFVEGAKCLREQRGQIMSRNKCRNPWFNQMDFVVRQGLPRVRGNSLALQLEVYNFLNLLNPDWGQRRDIGTTNPQFALLNRTGQQAAATGQPNTIPVFTFLPTTERYVRPLFTGQFYQMQLTARYSF